jgi:hypothetical protein
MDNVKIIHAGLDSTAPREKNSIKQLTELGLRYIRLENSPWDKTPPLDHVFEGNKHWYVGGSKKYNEFGLTPRHYGAFLSHKQSIFVGLADKEHFLVCEGDCKILDTEVFLDRLKEAVDVLDKSNYPLVRFEEPNFQTETKFYNQVSENIWECDKVINGHCYLINGNTQDFWIELFKEVGWHTPDWWLAFAFEKAGEKMLCFKEKLTHQFDGISEIDRVEKNYE